MPRTRRRRPCRSSRPAHLTVEMLESRLTPATGPGLVLAGASTPFAGPQSPGGANLLYDANNQPAINLAQGFWTGAYQQPGTNGYVGGSMLNVNAPFAVNKSTLFQQPVQTSDWWSPLMLRLDPQAVTSPSNPALQSPIGYANSLMAQDPAYVQFINDVLKPGAPRIQGLGIASATPDVFAVDPGLTGPDINTLRRVYAPNYQPLIVGIGGNASTGSDTPADEITPLDIVPVHYVDQHGQPQTSNQLALRARVNHYSDWGVQVAYGKGGSPDTPATWTDSLTLDLQNGSPFLFMTKKGPAYTKVWLRGNSEANSDGTEAINQVWGNAAGQLPGNVLGVTLTYYQTDESGVLRKNTSSYLVVASDATSRWTLDQDQTPSNPASPQLYKNPMSDGQITVVVLPHFVGGTRFEALSVADRVGVAQLLISRAGNVPVNNPSATQVSDPSLHTETYRGQNVSFGYDPAASTITTRHSVKTVNGQDTLQVLHPHQYDNLLPVDQGRFLTFTLNGQPVGLSYGTLTGPGRVYVGNDFATQLQYHGVLDALPGLAAQSDPVTAQALFDDAAAWMTRYLPDPNWAIGPTENTYQVGLMALGEQMTVLDQLAAPSSRLASAADRGQAAQWRDRLLADLKSQLFSWFDLSTGRLFFENTTYDTLIGFPAGFGSDFSVNDHHFHYGYFLNAFAAVARLDPAFTQALLPQVAMLIQDVANFDRTSASFPFLREFNPFAGHSWADGMGLGTNNEESASEAVNFYGGLVKLGAAVGRADWVAQGAYLYESEIEAMNQYWFNAQAQPELGNPGNWPEGFSDFVYRTPQAGTGVLATTPGLVTQVSSIVGDTTQRKLFFDPVNYAAGVNTINWLPTAAHMLFLGRNQAYLARNWPNFIREYALDGHKSEYDAVAAGYQALMPDDGFGLDRPGPTNALLRMSGDLNPAIAWPNASDPIVLGYRGTSRTIVLNWAYALRDLGQVDPTVAADTVQYGAFIKNGSRSFTAANPTGAPITVTFKDRTTGAVLARLAVGPGQTVTQLPDGRLVTDQPGQGPTPSPGTALYLGAAGSLQGTLTFQPGAAQPSALPASSTQQDVLNAYAGTFVTVPRRPGDRSTNNNFAPGNAAAIASFSLTGLSGSPMPGGTTGLQLFLNNGMTWSAAFSPGPRFANPYGPGVLENDVFGPAQAVVEVAYDFTGDGAFDRVETYGQARSPFNQYLRFDTTLASPGVLSPDTPDNRPVLLPGQSVLTPFEDMSNGSVRVRLWAGNYPTRDAGQGFPLQDPANKDFAVSVNADPNMARSSRLFIPYTQTSAPLQVLGVTTSSASLVNQPAAEAVVTLSGPARAGTFTAADLVLTRDGVPVPLGAGVQVTPLTGGAYRVTGLAPVQTQDGAYVLSVQGTGIQNALGSPASGRALTSWVLLSSRPQASLLTDTANPTDAAPIPVTVLFSRPVTGFEAADVSVSNGVLSNFRGDGQTYSFDLTPSAPGVTVTATVADGAARDAAGNLSLPASLSRTYSGAGPTVVLASTSADVSANAAIPVTATFSASVTGMSAAALLVRNATISGFTGTGATYSFTLTALQPGPVEVDVATGAAQDGLARRNSGSALLRRVYDPVAPTGYMTSITHPGTLEGSIPVMVQFSEPVTGFDAGKIVPTNAVVSGFQGQGDLYRFVLVPTRPGPVAADIPAGAGQDAAGNGSAAFPTFARVAEMLPRFSVSSPAGTPTSLTAVPVQVAFDEPVAFNPAGIAVGNGMVQANSFTQVAAGLYTFNVVPQNPGPVTVNVSPAAAVDAFGNSFKGNAVTYTFTYGRSPTVAFTAQPQNAYYFVTATFTSAVAGGGSVPEVVTGFDPSKITLSSPATITNFSGAGNVYLFRLNPTPPAGSYGSATISLGLAAGAVVTAQGTPNLASSSNVAVTTTGPTVVLATDALKTDTGNAVAPPGTTLRLRAVFSEPVKGFNANNLIPTNATIANFTGADGDSVFSFDLKPTAGATFATLVLNPLGPTQVTSMSGTPVMAPPGDFRVDYAAAPLVQSVTVPASVPDGTYDVGATIPIQVKFSAPVDVRGTPHLLLSTGGPGLNALVPCTAGSGTDTLTFTYVVQPRQASPKLDYDSTGALVMAPNSPDAIVQKGTNTPALLFLPYPGTAGSLGANRNLRIVQSVPTVVAVSSPDDNTVYKAGQTVTITVRFTDPVTVIGSPILALSTGAVATYASGSGTDTLTFTAPVSGGQRAVRLDYASTTALTGGSIVKAGTSTAVNRTLPSPGSPGSLGASRSLAVEARQPAVLFVDALVAADPSADPLAAFGIGAVIPIVVSFDSEVFVVGGTPLLQLTSGGKAVYASGSGTNRLVFNYTVAAGEQAARLDLTGPGALDPAGATLRDAAGNDIIQTLPVPGRPGSLAANKGIAVQTAAPKVVSVYSVRNGGLGFGDTVVLYVHFDVPVGVTVPQGQSVPTLDLNTGYAAKFISGLVATQPFNRTLVFAYLVGQGSQGPRPDENSRHLEYTSPGALKLNGSTIADAAGGTTAGNQPISPNPADPTLPAPGTAGSLASNNFLAVQSNKTLAPSVVRVSSPAANRTYGVGAVIPITVTFTRRVIVTGTPALTLAAGGGTPAQAVYDPTSGTSATPLGDYTLTLLYTVRPGDTATVLDYADVTSLAGGTITGKSTESGLPALLGLPTPGGAGSLSANNLIAVATTVAAPRVVAVSPLKSLPRTAFVKGAHVPISVTFDRPVTVSGSPTLGLETGATDGIARYASGSGSRTLTFDYVVGSDEGSVQLDHGSAAALDTAGGLIADAASGTPADTILPEPGSPGSLRASSLLLVGNRAPQGVSAGSDLVVAPGTVVTLHGRYNDADETVPATQSWVVRRADGSPVAAGTGATFTFVPTEPGFWYATYTVTDAAGHASSRTVTVKALDTPSREFVRAVYLDVLLREPEPTGWSYWTGVLDRTGSRQAVTRGIWETAEHRALQVDRFYLDYFYRMPDPAGRSHWVAALMGGMTEEKFASQLLASPEYLARNSPVNAFLVGLYRDVLGRGSDAAGLAGWTAAMQAGLAPSLVAEAFVQSVEAGRRRLQAEYLAYLGRPADAAGLTAAEAAWPTGIPAAGSSEAILASDEYFARAPGRF